MSSESYKNDSDVKEFRLTLELWAQDQTVARLRKLAAGMPYRSESKKAEIIAWLLRHNPAALHQARESS
jgi:hypothetical protein